MRLCFVVVVRSAHFGEHRSTRQRGLDLDLLVGVKRSLRLAWNVHRPACLFGFGGFLGRPCVRPGPTGGCIGMRSRGAQRVLAAFHDDVGESWFSALVSAWSGSVAALPEKMPREHPPRSVHTDDAGDDLASGP